MKQVSLFTGKLIRLAAPLVEDAEIRARWTHDEEYMRTVDTDFAQPKTVESCRNALQEVISDSTIVEFHVRTLDEDQLIGFVALHSIEWNNQKGSLAIGIGEAGYRGKGYGTDALRVILNYAFNELILHRVGLDVIASNGRAVRAYEKVGFKREGIIREAVHRDGKRMDLIYMGILRKEWNEVNQ
jgi:RimJ/RimL family protein N-acetyltransferase